MIVLPDVNVLVALAWPNHVHHESAHSWFSSRQRAGRLWATCPLSQSGFVRVSSNARVVSEARTPREAIELLERIVALPGHEFWSDDVSIVSSRHVSREKLQGYRQVTDAHLLALVLARGGALATFDRGIQALADAATASRAIQIIPLRS